MTHVWNDPTEDTSSIENRESVESQVAAHSIFDRIYRNEQIRDQLNDEDTGSRGQRTVLNVEVRRVPVDPGVNEEELSVR